MVKTNESMTKEEIVIAMMPMLRSRQRSETDAAFMAFDMPRINTFYLLPPHAS
jgi:hypothetical protein